MYRPILFLGIIALVVAGCSKDKVKKETLWGTYQEPVTAVELPPDSGVDELSLLWRDDIGSSDEVGFTRIHPAFAGDSLFVANRNGEVLRKAAETGETLWRTDLDEEIFSGAGVGDGLVVVTHDNGDVSALKATDGTLVWTSPVKRQFSSIPVIGKGRVIVRTADGLIIGLRADNGETEWQVKKEVPGLTMHGDSEPAITGDAVLIGLSNGKLIANNVINGRDYWEAEIGFVRGQNELERLNDSDTRPIVQGTTVYTATYQGSVMALQLQNASVLWDQNISTRLPMALADDVLIVTAEYGDIYALSTADGRILWQQDIFRGHGASYPVIAGQRVVIGDAEGNIHTLDIDTGALVETRETVSGAVTGLISSQGLIAVLSSEGKLSTLSL